MSLHLNRQCQRAQKSRQQIPPHLSGGYPLSSLLRKREKNRTGHRRDEGSSTSDSLTRQHPSAILFQFFFTGPETAPHIAPAFTLGAPLQQAQGIRHVKLY